MGANDGIVSTASLLVGVAAAEVSREGVLVAGLAGMVAGAMSMAAGEYVSVSSQADIERADFERERKELQDEPEFERKELADIYTRRGLEPSLAIEVADQLMAHDALGAHLRDELGISEVLSARPIQAALTSAATFTAGAAIPLVSAAIVVRSWIVPIVALSSLICLALLGGIAAKTAAAPILRSVARVTFWGILAMGITAGVGAIFGVAF